jgi:undecaprenyl phosphate N,N'-diacetylbacillosamine 1-phosphate transferase
MNSATPGSFRAYAGKETFDRLAAGAACLALASLAAGIAVASWVEDGGPPLSLAGRLGRDRRPFTELRFRSTRNAQPTQVGTVLRRTGLEQLPQLINVLRGDMSLVGPQPLGRDEPQRAAFADTGQDWRFAAKPGITGLAQLLAPRGARNAARLDRLYLRRQSLALDLQLLALSFAAHALRPQRIRRWLRRLGAPGRLRP